MRSEVPCSDGRENAPCRTDFCAFQRGNRLQSPRFGADFPALPCNTGNSGIQETGDGFAADCTHNHPKLLISDDFDFRRAPVGNGRETAPLRGCGFRSAAGRRLWSPIRDDTVPRVSPALFGSTSFGDAHLMLSQDTCDGRARQVPGAEAAIQTDAAGILTLSESRASRAAAASRAAGRGGIPGAARRRKVRPAAVRPRWLAGCRERGMPA